MLDAMLRQWNRWRLGCDNSSSAPSHSPCFCHCMHRRGLGLCIQVYMCSRNNVQLSILLGPYGWYLQELGGMMLSLRLKIIVAGE